MIKFKKVRKATCTVKVPIQFTFLVDNDMDLEELFNVAEIELERRLQNKYYDLLRDEWELVKKDTHYTREEKAKMEKEKREQQRIFPKPLIGGAL